MRRNKKKQKGTNFDHNFKVETSTFFSVHMMTIKSFHYLCTNEFLLIAYTEMEMVAISSSFSDVKLFKEVTWFLAITKDTSGRKATASYALVLVSLDDVLRYGQRSQDLSQRLARYANNLSVMVILTNKLLNVDLFVFLMSQWSACMRTTS